MVYTYIRDRIAAEDLAFVLRTLADEERQALALVRLLHDPATRDEILDHEALYTALLDQPGWAGVSPGFYFYLTLRHALRPLGLEDRAMADYLASLLARFVRTEEVAGAAPIPGAKNFTYLSDLLMAVSLAPSSESFARRRHLGDYALFCSGLFPERVEAQARRHGGPGLGFYESVGQGAYRIAAHDPRALRWELRRLLQEIADQFHALRLMLNRLAGDVWHFHPQVALP